MRNSLTFSSRYRLFNRSLRRLGVLWDKKSAVILVIIAVFLCSATYAALQSAPPFGDNSTAVIWLLNIDLIALGILGVLIARRVILLYTIWKRGIPGARLHLRFVYIFGLLAMVPAVIMTLFSLFFFHYGVQTWFSDRVKTAVNESQAVAESYLREHHQVIRADIMAMAKDLDKEATLFIVNPQGFAKFVQTQAMLRGLTEAVLFDQSGYITNQVGIGVDFDIKDFPPYVLKNADQGDVVLLTDINDSQIRALVKLTNFPDTYLYVSRMVESNVLNHLQTTREAVQKYDEISSNYMGLQTTISLIYVVVALILLFSAIWFALIFARRLAQPIIVLIEASDRVRQGDLTAHISENSGFQEFDFLARSFNRMTLQIRDQRNELMNANRRIDERRQFTETILAGVTSGVLSVDDGGLITLANTSACTILGKDKEKIVGRNIETVIPHVSGLISEAYLRPDKIHQSEIAIQMDIGGRRVLLVRIAIELLGERDLGAVVTFDDITNLQSAQRKSAWADVARRIAHEIKNPLTPIQLSAERLKRRYLDKMDTEKDREIFGQCIDTIIRHVGDIGHMVSEFSSFARLPEPIFKPCDVSSIVSDTLMFYRQAHPKLTYLGKESINILKGIEIDCDEQQIRQVITNIIQNSLDSIEERAKFEDISPVLGLWMGRDSQGNFLICVGDNGVGLPKDKNHDTLTEPYVTFKEKGTGLGLAIVKKIMEDHGGHIVFGITDEVKLIPGWEDLGGAVVTLVLPDRKVN
ncbi:MAG: PAS domain-containing sensor histidine kinase [Alphaproteobacteria bacterium]|nr:PAS domain-containing sensor histidine kinase [Alphaproteobacteria bacterium]